MLEACDSYQGAPSGVPNLTLKGEGFSRCRGYPHPQL
jgi:hypothetical protein